MALQVADIRTAARTLLNDAAGGPVQRYSDDVLFEFIFQAVQAHSLSRPDLFSAEATLTAGASAPDDRFQATRLYHSGPLDSLRMMEVLEYLPASGSSWMAVNEVDYPQLVDQTAEVAAAGAVVQRRSESSPLLYGGSADDRDQRTAPEWARHPKSPNRFFFTPAPAAGAQLRVEYSQIPALAPGATEIPLLGDGYRTSMIHAVVWLAESVNDASVVSGRARMFQEAFMGALNVEAQARVITDEQEQTPTQAEARG